jgi:hypothetical protein
MRREHENRSTYMQESGQHIIDLPFTTNRFAMMKAFNEYLNKFDFIESGDINCKHRFLIDYYFECQFSFYGWNLFWEECLSVAKNAVNCAHKSLVVKSWKDCHISYSFDTRNDFFSHEEYKVQLYIMSHWGEAEDGDCFCH